MSAPPRLPAVAALWRREVVTFLRDRTRVMGTLAQPLVLWGLLGLGFGGSFQMPDGSDLGYGAYLFPGIVALVALFASLFGSISVIEDRERGALQGVLVAPQPRGVVATGMVSGVATLAAGQGVLVLVAAPLVGLSPGLAGWLVAVAAVAGLSVTVAALGFALAWRSATTRGFHALMNLVLIPLWALSGAVFPPDGLPAWARPLVWADPVSYPVALLRYGLGDLADAPGALPSLGVAAVGTVVSAALALGVAAWAFGRPRYRSA